MEPVAKRLLMPDAVVILHQDEHLLVVEKPPGVLVVAAPGRRGATLIDRLRAQMRTEIFAVHRLDEGTTGALVVARTLPVRIALEGLFRTHAIRREYLALVSGRPSPAAGRIESNLTEDGDIVRVVARGGRMAITDYESIARRGSFTLVRCVLATGRRNQIRVHMSALGCPIAGDRKYGYRPRHGGEFKRPMLHSWRLGFAHPVGGDLIEVVAEPPEKLLRVE